MSNKFVSAVQKVLNQSKVHPSFWVLRTVTWPLQDQQLMMTNDFGDLVPVNHGQFRVSSS